MAGFLTTEIVTLVGGILGAVLAVVIENAIDNDRRDGGPASHTRTRKIFWMLSGGVIGSILTLGSLVLLGYISLDSLINSASYDNFNDSIYDGRYDPKIWSATVSSPNSVRQQNGLMILSNEPDSGNEVTSLFAKRILGTETGFYVQTRMLLSGESAGEYAETGVGVTTSLSNGVVVRYGCVISRNNLMEVWCEVWGRTSEAEYKTQRKVSYFDTWYTIRIEVAADTTINFFIDGEKIGSYQPTDADLFANASNVFHMEIWSPSDDGVVGKYDDIKIGNLR
jgi:hypothetical protein